MISCVYVTRDEGRVVVAFSRPVNVSLLTCIYEFNHIILTVLRSNSFPNTEFLL